MAQEVRHPRTNSCCARRVPADSMFFLSPIFAPRPAYQPERPPNAVPWGKGRKPPSPWPGLPPAAPAPQTCRKGVNLLFTPAA